MSQKLIHPQTIGSSTWSDTMTVDEGLHDVSENVELTNAMKSYRSMWLGYDAPLMGHLSVVTEQNVTATNAIKNEFNKSIIKRLRNTKFHTIRLNQYTTKLKELENVIVNVDVIYISPMALTNPKLLNETMAQASFEYTLLRNCGALSPFKPTMDANGNASTETLVSLVEHFRHKNNMPTASFKDALGYVGFYPYADELKDGKVVTHHITKIPYKLTKFNQWQHLIVGEVDKEFKDQRKLKNVSISKQSSNGIKQAISSVETYDGVKRMLETSKATAKTVCDSMLKDYGKLFEKLSLYENVDLTSTILNHPSVMDLNYEEPDNPTDKISKANKKNRETNTSRVLMIEGMEISPIKQENCNEIASFIVNEMNGTIDGNTATISVVSNDKKFDISISGFSQEIEKLLIKSTMKRKSNEKTASNKNRKNKS